MESAAVPAPRASMEFTVADRSFVATGDGWRIDDSATLVGTAGPRTDMFVDPQTGEATVNAPRLLTPAPDGDFQLAARVEVDFSGTYDAATLLVWAGEETWAKLCFEYSPQGKPMIVSVVTRGRSDDANGFTVEGNVVWLRISGIRGAYAFHASADGRWWHLIRHFTLGAHPAEVGFEVQSPLGEGCRGTYTGITYRADTLGDLRDGR